MITINLNQVCYIEEPILIQDEWILIIHFNHFRLSIFFKDLGLGLISKQKVMDIYDVLRNSLSKGINEYTFMRDPDRIEKQIYSSI